MTSTNHLVMPFGSPLVSRRKVRGPRKSSSRILMPGTERPKNNAVSSSKDCNRVINLSGSFARDSKSSSSSFFRTSRSVTKKPSTFSLTTYSYILLSCSLYISTNSTLGKTLAKGSFASNKRPTSAQILQSLFSCLHHDTLSWTQHSKMPWRLTR